MRAVSDRLTQKTRTMRASVHNSMFFTSVRHARAPSLFAFSADRRGGWWVQREERVCVLVQLCWLVWVNARRVGPRFGQVEPNEEGVREECAFFSPMSICTHSVCLDLCLLAQTRSQISSARALGCRFGFRSVSASAGFSCVPCLTRGRACWQSDLI